MEQSAHRAAPAHEDRPCLLYFLFAVNQSSDQPLHSIFSANLVAVKAAGSASWPFEGRF
jgi:hypothetical protein